MDIKCIIIAAKIQLFFETTKLFPFFPQSCTNFPRGESAASAAWHRYVENLNDDLAIKLERHLGIPYKTWMDLHNGYMYDCTGLPPISRRRYSLEHQ